MQVSGGEYAAGNLGIVYGEEVCLISLESRVFLANCGGRDKKSESQGTKEAPRDLGTLERSWVPLLMSVNLSQGPWGL